MNVRQVATYLQLNEKKIYSLVSEGNIPATKVTGKWMFPRELVDRWLIESSHGGVLTDRLAVAGSDDPLLQRVVNSLARRIQARANVSYNSTGTQLGLSLLAHQRADICALHWGPANESQHRHSALLRQYPQHRDWVLVRIFKREQGLIVRPEHAGRPGQLLQQAELRWVMRQEGSGSQRYLQEMLARHKLTEATLKSRVVAVALSERDAGARLAMNEGDIAPGTRGSAAEFGLGFIPVGWEAFDLALYRGIYFRKLFQHLLDGLGSEETLDFSRRLGGYDLGELGRIVWSP
jgi:excisionase family DNA binding protein